MKSDLDMKFSIVLLFFVLPLKAKCEGIEETRPSELKISKEASNNNGSEALATESSKKVRNTQGLPLDSVNRAAAKNLKQKHISLNHQLGKILRDKLSNYPSPPMRPMFYGPRVQVKVNVIIREILSFSEVDMHIKLNLVLELIWNDPSLEFEHIKENVTEKYNDWVWLMDNSVKEKIWIPPVSILNEKEAASHSPRFVQESLAWRPSGWMVFRSNVVTTLSCAMSLKEFPMDTQICNILIGSPTYGINDLYLEVHHYFHRNFSSAARNVKLLGVRVSSSIYPDGYASRRIHSLELLLERFVGYYIIGTFFPSALIVIVSWLTFWMARDESGEKMALGVTCVLTITTLLISVQASAPKVSYIKAIDIYMGACFTLVFSTLLISTAVNYLLRKLRGPGAAKKSTEECEQMIESSRRNGRSPPINIVRRILTRNLEAQEKVKVTKFILRCNLWCRVIFPLIFALFNVSYWTYYSAGSTKFDSAKGWESLIYFSHF